MSLKYTSFVTPLVIVALIVWVSFKYFRNTQYAARNSFIVLAAFTLPALIIASPWYIKNWAFTGNPVYPFLFGLFGGKNWDAFRAAWYAGADTGLGRQPGTLLALPWLLTLGVRDVNFWDGRTGPLLLLFLPPVIWAGVTRRLGNRALPGAGGVLLLYALAHFGVWTLGVIWSRALWQSRLLLPGLVALVPVTAWVWANLSTFDLPRFSLSRFVNIAVALTLALALVDIGLLTLKINPVPYLAGLETRPAYLTRRLGAYYPAMEEINKQLPAEAAVLFLWEPRSYYCQRDCRPDSILDEFPHRAHQYGTAEAIAENWRKAGLTHVLVHRTGLDFMRNELPGTVDEELLNDLQRTYWREVADVAGAYQLYELK